MSPAQPRLQGATGALPVERAGHGWDGIEPDTPLDGRLLVTVPRTRVPALTTDVVERTRRKIRRER